MDTLPVPEARLGGTRGSMKEMGLDGRHARGPALVLLTELLCVKSSPIISMTKGRWVATTPTTLV
jgi:hypothetical protein